MIDHTLLGAIERALERNESREFIKHSLANNDYSMQDVEEAINLVLFRKQQSEKAFQTLQQPEEKRIILKEKLSFHIGKELILLSSLSAALIAFIAFYAYIQAIQSSCNELGLPTLKKNVLAFSINCIQVNIIYIETWIAILTTLALIIVVVYLMINARNSQAI